MNELLFLFFNVLDLIFTTCFVFANPFEIFFKVFLQIVKSI
jgi:hypothetical protein